MDNPTGEPSTRGDGASPFSSVPIEISVSVGRARPLIRDLLRLDEGSVLTLDRKIDDPVELYVGDQLIGTGALEVIEADGQSMLAVRLMEVADFQALS